MFKPVSDLDNIYKNVDERYHTQIDHWFAVEKAAYIQAKQANSPVTIPQGEDPVDFLDSFFDFCHILCMHDLEVMYLMPNLTALGDKQIIRILQALEKNNFKITIEHM